MDLYLDSADRDALAPLLATGLFRGVTTNPLILQRAGVRLSEVPSLVSWLLAEGADEVFVQTTAADADAIEREGHALRDLSDKLVVKVPATAPGLVATRRLSAAGVPVLLTVVYHPNQAVLAAAAGARFIAPYLGRMTEAGRDGRADLRTMARALAGTGTGVLVASVRDAAVVPELAADGLEAVTVGTDVARAMFAEPLTDAAMVQFDAATAALR